MEHLIREIRDHVTIEVHKVLYEDPYGTKQITSLNSFNPQILPSSSNKGKKEIMKTMVAPLPF